MDYKINHIPISKIRPGTKMNPTTITIHSTANPKSTAINERNWLTNPSNDRVASWHIVVDENMAVEAIPLNEIAFHAGVREGNNTSIGIEICESGDRAKTLQNAVELTARLLHERSWGIDKLRRHYDWSGKICPGILSANNWEGWNAFKIQIQRELDKLNQKVKVNIKGKDYYLDGFLKDGTNYVPIRAVAEALGYKVDWDQSTKTVIIK